MDEQMKALRDKAAVLADALPYLRDFNEKIIVIGYLCCDMLSGEDEQEVMRDITLLKSVGMKPVIVHDARMGADKFRENKRLAKLVEFCGTKAVGICGIDEQTLHMTLDNGYIPVVTPNDIDTEHMKLDPADTAREIAVLLQAEKLVYLGKYAGVTDKEGKKILSMTESELKRNMEELRPEGDYLHKLENAVRALDGGVYRVHFLNGKMQHALLLELFSVLGVGTVILGDDRRMYAHEKNAG